MSRKLADKAAGAGFFVVVPDFPRGGGSKLSKREREEIRAEVDAQFDGEGGEFKGGKRRKNMAGAGMRRKAAAEDELGSLFGDGIKGKLPRFANKVTLKNISPGMKLWGIVAEVNEKDLAVSLPGGLHGLVRADDAVDAAILGGIKDGGNDFLSGIFHIGQLVSCIVSQVEDDMKESHKKRVWVSLCLSLLHKGLTLDTPAPSFLLQLAYFYSNTFLFLLSIFLLCTSRTRKGFRKSDY